MRSPFTSTTEDTESTEERNEGGIFAGKARGFGYVLAGNAALNLPSPKGRRDKDAERFECNMC
jgi:hypothetical protein